MNQMEDQFWVVKVSEDQSVDARELERTSMAPDGAGLFHMKSGEQIRVEPPLRWPHLNNLVRIHCLAALSRVRKEDLL